MHVYGISRQHEDAYHYHEREVLSPSCDLAGAFHSGSFHRQVVFVLSFHAAQLHGIGLWVELSQLAQFLDAELRCVKMQFVLDVLNILLDA